MAIYISSRGRRALEEELHYCKTVKLEAITEAMETAISMGDLHEYDEAKALREKTQARIAELEEMLQKIVVIDSF